MEHLVEDLTRRKSTCTLTPPTPGSTSVTLPAPRADTSAAVLSSTEILVIGGFYSPLALSVNTEYKGTLYLKS